MKCPNQNCDSEKFSVVDSRKDGSSIRRRRECLECKFRFSTYERIEFSLPMVVKKDGRREVFNSDKIRLGLIKACEKRDVSIEKIDQTVDGIQKQVQELSLKEIPATKIGDIIIDHLKELDQIAYVRFASVYREFTDLAQFIDTLKELSSKSEDDLNKVFKSLKSNK